MKPIRIQMQRTKGWRKPENTVVVARPSRWGNSFRVSRGHTAQEAVDAYRREMPEFTKEAARLELAGKNLACWCKPGAPCHADVLLEIANGHD
jgi:hypothetical protein